VFYSTPVADSSFSSTFNFQVKKGSTSTIGNGFTFVLQNHGLGTVGGTGLALGYQYIPNSVAVSFDVMKNNTTLYINGEPTSTSTSLTDNGLNIANGDIFQVTFTYDGTTLRWNIRDANAIVTNYSRDSVAINIPQSIGSNTAYVGFTAGTSTATAIIDILDWTFTNP